VASAALTVASEVLNFVIVVWVLRRELGRLGLAAPFVKVGSVATATAAILWVLHPYGIFVGVPVGILVTLVGIRLTHVLGQTERDVIGRLPVVGRYVKLVY